MFLVSRQISHWDKNKTCFIFNGISNKQKFSLPNTDYLLSEYILIFKNLNSSTTLKKHVKYVIPGLWEFN